MTALDPVASNLLAQVARYHGLDASPLEDLSRIEWADKPLPFAALAKAALATGLDVRASHLRASDLLALKVVLPILGLRDDGTTFIISAILGDRLQLENAAVEIFDPKRLGDPKTRVSIGELMPGWSGRVISIRRLRPKNEVPESARRWFLQSILMHRGQLLTVFAATLGINLLSITVPLFFQIITNRVIPYQSADTLITITVAIILGLSFNAILLYGRSIVVSHVTAKIDCQLNNDVYAKLLSLPIGFFESMSVGATAKSVQQIDEIRRYMSGTLLPTVLEATSLFIIVPILFIYNVQLSLIVCLLAVMNALAIGLTLRPFIDALGRLNKQESLKQGELVESIRNMPIIKALSLENWRMRQWCGTIDAATKIGVRVNDISAIALSAVTLLERLTAVAIMVVGAMKIVYGEMSLGALIAFSMLANLVAGPITRIVVAMSEFLRVRVAFQTLDLFFRESPEDYVQIPRSRHLLRGQVGLQDVTFTYPGRNTPALENCTLSVQPGEYIGIVGASGSGKSTLTKLVQGLYIPDRGTVTFDDLPIAQLELRGLRKQLGVVLQDSFLFHGTIRQNIGVGRLSARLDEIVGAAQEAGALDFISSLRLGFETTVEEGGINLSGGQRQRIAIARALIRNPRLLIFDEATSALDSESEALVQSSIESLSLKRTVIVISHRLSTLKNAHRLFVLSKGRIEAAGTHAELLRCSPTYIALSNAQIKFSSHDVDMDVSDARSA